MTGLVLTVMPMSQPRMVKAASPMASTVINVMRSRCTWRAMMEVSVAAPRVSSKYSGWAIQTSGWRPNSTSRMVPPPSAVTMPMKASPKRSIPRCIPMIAPDIASVTMAIR